MTEPTADAWIAACEAQAAQVGLARGAAFWDAGWEWIAAERDAQAAGVAGPPEGPVTSGGKMWNFPEGPDSDNAATVPPLGQTR